MEEDGQLAGAIRIGLSSDLLSYAGHLGFRLKTAAGIPQQGTIGSDTNLRSS